MPLAQDERDLSESDATGKGTLAAARDPWEGELELERRGTYLKRSIADLWVGREFTP